MMEAEHQVSLNEQDVDLEFFEEQDCSAYFVNSTEHLFAEVERIDLLLQYHLVYIQKIFASQDYYRGLYISEQDIERLVRKPIGEPWWTDKTKTMKSQELRSSMKTLEVSIEKRKSESIAQGVRLNLEVLTNAFGLSTLEKDIILLALAPEIDLRYGIMYAYLQDDIAKKYLSIDLVLNLLRYSVREKIRIRQLLASKSNLSKYRLVEINDETTQAHGGLLNRVIKLPARLISFLLGLGASEEELEKCVKLVSLDDRFSKNVLHSSSQQSLNHLAAHLKNSQENCFVLVQGISGSGRRSSAIEITKARQRELLSVDLGQLKLLDIDSCGTSINSVVREAMMQKADLYCFDIDRFPKEEREIRKQNLLDGLSDFAGIVYIADDDCWLPKFINHNSHVLHLKLAEITSVQRASFWETNISSLCQGFTQEDLVYLAERFRFTPGKIREVITAAKQLAETKKTDSKFFTLKNLFQACRLSSNRKLTTLARSIVPKHGWEDIILVEEKLQQLRALHSTVQHRTKVFNDWGFNEKLSLGKGVNALFTGPPGTGKTMAAEIIAKSLGLELYKIDLSLVVSKYIGETEKNLSKIFREAETSNAIIFFDEADALFGKRTEIKNSHDRYANIEVAYLLQKMEEFDGITILASNLRKNMDEAFVRRLAFIIRFPFPGHLEREKIWRSIWPSKTPLSADIDLKFMAEQFKLAGGSIKNIAIASAFLAAEDSEEISMKHLVESTKREFEKQGRTSVKADFGRYGELLN